MSISPNFRNGDLYPVITVPCGDDKQMRNFHQILCCHYGCKERLLLSPGQRGRIGNDGIIKFAKQKGWFADKKGYALCAVHNFTRRKTAPGNKNEKKPTQKQAAFLSMREKECAAKMAEIRKPSNDTTSPLIVSPIKEEELATLAEPPRQATREDKRRIRDFLDMHYDEDRQCWCDDWSDAKAATKLAMPRAWVTALRDDLYGPDICEADQKKNTEAAKLGELAAKLQEDALAIAARAEQLEQMAKKLTKE